MYLTREQAFDVLRLSSPESNVEPREVARQVCEKAACPDHGCGPLA
ncbi:hypothetical protein [Streptomyces sp. NPDC096934]